MAAGSFILQEWMDGWICVLLVFVFLVLKKIALLSSSSSTSQYPVTDYNGVPGGGGAGGVTSDGSPSSQRNSLDFFFNSNMSKSNRQLPLHLHGSVITALLFVCLFFAKYHQHNLGYPITGVSRVAR